MTLTGKGKVQQQPGRERGERGERGRVVEENGGWIRTEGVLDDGDDRVAGAVRDHLDRSDRASQVRRKGASGGALASDEFPLLARPRTNLIRFGLV